jgi:uncharacterized membrane protein (UPF0127 family)
LRPRRTHPGRAGSGPDAGAKSAALRVVRTGCAVALLASFAFFAAAPAQEAPGRQPLSDFARTTLRIETPSGRAHRFEVYVARSDREHMQGLMYVESLPPGEGMIFPYDPPRPVAMWMKNTLIPLDMLFIRADGTIANIIADVEPQSLDSRRSDGPVALVLELNGGTAKKLGIAAGARVRLEGD